MPRVHRSNLESCERCGRVYDRYVNDSCPKCAARET